MTMNIKSCDFSDPHFSMSQVIGTRLVVQILYTVQRVNSNGVPDL